MTTKLYLDTRGSDDKDKEYPVKVAINLHGSTAYIGTGLKVKTSEWDRKTCKVIVHPLKSRYNLKLSEKKLDVDKALDDLLKKGELKGLTLAQIKNKVNVYINPDEGSRRQENAFLARLTAYADKAKTKGTRVNYLLTAKKVREFSSRAEELTFEDITRDWLRRFDAFMAETAPSANSRNIHLRNIRAVFNEALDDEVTQNYPFRKFKIKAEPTKDRSLRPETLRAMFDCDCEPWQTEYRDIFKLMFLLCGINMGDLANLTEIRNGRIEYRRLKTGQLVSVRVRPEAMEIIERYRGKDHLLSILERYGDYRDYLHHLNDQLKRLGLKYDPHGKRYGGVPICAEASTYYSRYSWATIATELDVPEKVIAAALGHSTSSVTDIYIRTDMRKKVDAANDKVIDYVLYGKLCAV